MTDNSFIMVVNPGSSSRKYALFQAGNRVAVVNFEYLNNRVVSKLTYDDKTIENSYEDEDLSNTSNYVLSAFIEAGIINSKDNIDAIGLRLVCPSSKFTQNVLVTPDIKDSLKSIQQKAPLHVGTVIAEIDKLGEYLSDTPIIIVSDSAFHTTKPDYASYYGIDIDLSNQLDIKRYGFHGISVSSVVNKLAQAGKLLDKTVICHLGSGSSISAIKEGKSVDNTMGYTPLDGLMMATRSGSMDISAAVEIKKHFGFTPDEVEEYLNKKCGLLGVSGSSNDIRQLLEKEASGDERAKLALEMFVYRVQLAIGQMVASLGGIDQLVITATIGERSAPIRQRILDGLSYLGLEYDKNLNNEVYEPKDIVDLSANSSKPILVVATDEAAEIARQTRDYIEKNK